MIRYLSAEAIGRQIRRIRTERGLTQEEVARRAGWAAGSGWRISDYENGKKRPQGPTLRKIARGLGVDVAVFERRDPDYHPERVGQTLRRLRAERGWTQADLAERLSREGVTARVVGAWERADTLPRLSDLREIAHLCDVSLSIFEGQPIEWLEPETIGHVIRTLRRDAGLTQAELARAIGKPGHQQHVSRWERGSGQTTRSLVLLADAFDRPLSVFQRGGERVLEVEDAESQGVEEAVDWALAGRPAADDDGFPEPVERASDPDGPADQLTLAL